jgi:1,4-alpha-glucan branching enzyme
MRSFDYYAKRGRIELLTTLATHPFAPLYEQYPDNLRAQTQVALEEFRRNFGKHSQGLWLPEAGYSSGLDPILGESGIRYFFTAAHGVLFGDPRPKRGVYAPVRTQNGLYVFPREPASANAVWSSDEGYPGDFAYRDFYRDIGFDLPLDYVGPYLPAPNIRSNTGFKYYAITGDTEDKRVYDRDVALSRVEEHADNFLYIQRKLMAKLAPLLDREPLIVCPFDAELFGHWWFEGVDWLETVLRKIGTEDHGVSMVTPPQYIRAHPDNQRVDPAFSSWGNKGYSEVWLDGSNDWIYRHTHKAIERMMELCDRFPNEGGLRRRALNQAAREVLLSQASDWPFVMRAGTTVPYAVRRVKEHIANFTHIYESLSGSTVSTEWLTRTERRNSAFPDIDYRMFKQSIQRSGFPDIEIVK